MAQAHGPAARVSGNATLVAACGVWALLLGMGLIMLGNGLQASLLGVRASLEGFDTSVTGFVMSSYFVGFLAGSTLTPRAVRRVGHVRVFAALASLASIAVLVHGMLVEPVVWGAMRLVTGFSYAGLYVVAESWLNDRAGNEMRGRLLSVYMVIQFLGLGLGQLLLNAADPGRHELFILVSVLVSFALVPILLSATPAPDYEAPSPVGLRHLYAVSPLGVVGCMGTGVANGAVFGMAAVYAGNAGLSVTQISLFMVALFAGGALLQWPLGRLSDRLDRRKVIAATTFLAAAAAAAVPLGGVSGLALLVAAFVFGGATLSMYSLCIAHTNDYLEPGQMVAASAGLVLVLGVGAILGPSSAGAAMSLLGPPGYFWFLAAVHAAIGGFALYRMGRRPSKPLAEQGPYMAVPAQPSPLATAAREEAAEAACAEAGAEADAARAG